MLGRIESHEELENKNTHELYWLSQQNLKLNELSSVSISASDSLKKLNNISTSHTYRSYCLKFFANYPLKISTVTKSAVHLSLGNKACKCEKKIYSDQTLCNFPMLKHAEEKLPTHKHANAKSHPQPGLLGLSGWAVPFYRGISGQSRSLLPPPDLHWEPSDINQNLSGLSHPHQLHTDTDTDKRSVVLDSFFFYLHSSWGTHDRVILIKHSSMYGQLLN